MVATLPIERRDEGREPLLEYRDTKSFVARAACQELGPAINCHRCPEQPRRLRSSHPLISCRCYTWAKFNQKPEGLGASCSVSIGKLPEKE